ncbi:MULTISPECIES: polyprenyl synthetase family protein [unclassified Streptomyces]|uniref:polyprenyl synthetase family protein n=1 Tax=unclassified Streptomyces TaxID=2593676 RepID=UPI0022378A5F|nr:polyprenyl synthetase family protein [Streptomyces sp. SHP 1-2]MCW5250396.1 polyprenyl synthetase family protein [Streptomyces sp. SHP 1-2]
MPAGQQGELTHQTVPPQGRQPAGDTRPDTPHPRTDPHQGPHRPLPGPQRHDTAPAGPDTPPHGPGTGAPWTPEADIEHLYPARPRPGTAEDLLTADAAGPLLPETARRLEERVHTALIAPVRGTVDHGGRRWRPRLAATVVEALGADSRRYGPLWAACELLHTGSLIVDDIQDDAPLRRGRPSAHLVHGTATAINAGTMAYFSMYRAVRRTLPADGPLRTAVYETYLDALQSAHTGQALDIQGHHEEMAAALDTGDTAVLEQLVILTHRLKSGEPVAGAFRIAALVAGAGPAECDALAALGRAVGTAYQITDDVADLRCAGPGGTAAKRPGEDLLNGKVTHPLVRAVALLPRDEARRLWKEVRSGPDPDGAARAARRVADSGALDLCAAEARRMVRDAWEAVAALLPVSPSSLSLGRLCAEALRSRIA